MLREKEKTMPEDEGYYPKMEDESSSESTEELEDSGETSILPMSFFQGKEVEPGKKCEVEVVAVYGDEVEVKYVEHREKDDDKSNDDDDEAVVMVGIEEE